MLNNQVPKSKPQGMATTRPQGAETNDSFNNTTFKDSRSRYDKGMELYKEGKVKLSFNGLFKVSGYYECDPEKMTCTCPDYRTRKESCKHLFAAMLFVKNRGKQSIENLEGHGNGAPSKQPANKPTDTPNKLQEARSKEFDRQAVITASPQLTALLRLLRPIESPLNIMILFLLRPSLRSGLWEISAIQS